MSIASGVAEMAARMERAGFKDDEKKMGEDRLGGKLDEKAEIEAGKDKKGNEESNSDRKPRSNSQQDPAKSRLTQEEREKVDEERLAKYMEEQQKKTVLEKGCKGIVKWFSIRNKYGFIERDEKGKDDVFVHQMAISNSSVRKYFYRTLEEGEPVEFDIVEGKKGPEAANVTGPEGGQVKGVRIVFVSRRNSNGRRVTRRRQMSKNKQSEGEDGGKSGKEADAGKKKSRNNRRRGRRNTAKSDTSNGKETRGKGTGKDKVSGDNSAAVAVHGSNTVQTSRMSSAKPILYSFWRSSCAWRVRIALNLKKIDYEYRSVNVLSKEEKNSPEWIKVNPSRKVPAFVDGDATITESLAIIEYLEEKYKDRGKPLLPKNLTERAQSRAIALHIAAGIQPLQNVRVLGYVNAREPGSASEWGHHWVTDGLKELETLVGRSAGSCAVANQVSIADLCIPSILANAKRFNVDLSQFPRLLKINDHLSRIPEFQAAEPERQPDAVLHA
ncbi:hypothetical protein WR25_08110 [Diploscapter pachys]|uniref:maleylacetoacetate isomerase n=1 Tax=Diploscapter pachys TaxID=2018661 RepID=A0A2A2JM20_9BILA|nr:hypothetical protein WR25_08110 [Diploscapter pachys]